MTDPAFWLFLASVVVISLSGVIVPGPLLAVAVAKGPEGPHAGALVGLGHGIVELPLIALIALGFGTVFTAPAFRIGAGLLGGLVLLYLGAGIVRARGSLAAGSAGLDHHAVTSGAVATLVNPYFFFWWATIGAALVLKASAWGAAGLLLFGLVHWSCDLGWYWLVTAAISRGKAGGTLPRALYFCSGLLLIGFGLLFLGETARQVTAGR